jgi:hypothetical protein
MRNYAKAFFAFAALAVVSACGDSSTVAPVAQAPVAKAPANYSQVGDPVVFRVDNAYGATQLIGGQVVSIPAGAICDPATSGYGPTYWDQPCDPLVGSVEITATVFTNSFGQPYVDFQPAMRFSPDQQVMVFMRDGTTDPSKLTGMMYCNADLVCVDESLADPSLKPFRVTRSHIIGRRVKHFSGYNVNWEGDCPGTATPIGDGTYYCEVEDGGGAERRSGYMVASGEDITDIMKDDNNNQDENKGDKKKDQQ